jgi:hypothetical protein
MAPPTDPGSPGGAPPGEARSSLLRFGGVVGAGTLGAAMAAAPAALRLEGAAGVCSPVGVWALLFAVAIVPMSVAVVGLRRARAGLLALGRSEGMTPVAMLVAWLVSCFVALTLLGALLRARTHHRALGGVVFALGAFVVAVGLALVLVRVGSMVRRASLATRWVLAALGAAALGFAVALARHQLAREAAPPFSVAEGARLVDGLAFVLSAFIASGYPFVQRRVIALVGPPLAAIVLILGVSSWRACPSLRDALEERAPLFSWMVSRGP